LTKVSASLLTIFSEPALSGINTTKKTHTNKDFFYKNIIQNHRNNYIFVLLFEIKYKKIILKKGFIVKYRTQKQLNQIQEQLYFND